MRGRTPSPASPAGARRVLAVFSGRTDIGWLRLLKPGFRHCFLVVRDGGVWIAYEPLAHRTEITVLPVPPDFDLAAWYRAQGLRVVETTPAAAPLRPAPWRPFTCVEAVKRALGIHARRVFTPWQLYRLLAGDDRRRGQGPTELGTKTLTEAEKDDIPLRVSARRLLR